MLNRWYEIESKIGHSCASPTEKYEEDIEEMLIDKVEGTERKVCYELTKACDGVDRTKKDKDKLDFRFNGQKQEVKHDDGIQRMNVDINDPGAAERVAEQIRSQLGRQPAGAGPRGGDDDDDDDENHSDDDDDINEDDGEGKETQAVNEKTEL